MQDMENRARRQQVSPGRAVVGLAIVELLLLTVGVTDTAPAILSTAAGSVLGIEVSPVTAAVRLLFFGLTAAVILPQLTPVEFAPVVDQPGFRLVAATITVGTGVLFSTLIGETSTPQFLLVGITVGGVALTTGCVAALVYRRGVELGSAVQTIERRLGGTASDMPGQITACVYVGVGLGTGLTLAGLPVAVGGLLYPLPELLAVGWPVGVAIAARCNWHATPQDHVENAVAIVATVRRSEKGLPALTLVMLGLGMPATILAVGLPVYARRLLVGGTVSIAEPGRTWAVIGMVVGIAVACLYAIWFWGRVFRRLPAFLAAWHEAAGVAAINRETVRKPVVRPTWLLLPFALVITHAILLIQIGDVTDFAFYGAAESILSLYGLVWPLSVAVIGLAVYWTVRRTPQPPLSATYAIPAATIVEFGSLYVGWGIAAAVVRSGGLTASELVRFPGGPFVLLVLALLLLLFFGPDIAVRVSDSQARRVALSYLPLAAILLLFAGFNLHGYQLAWGIMGGLLMAGSLSEAWKHRRGEHQQQSNR